MEMINHQVGYLEGIVVDNIYIVPLIWTLVKK